jgi:hypothetical protein
MLAGARNNISMRPGTGAWKEIVVKRAVIANLADEITEAFLVQVWSGGTPTGGGFKQAFNAYTLYFGSLGGSHSFFGNGC